MLEEVKKIVYISFTFDHILLLVLSKKKYVVFFQQDPFYSFKKHEDPARTRTWNLLIRSQTPYPLGHEAETMPGLNNG